MTEMTPPTAGPLTPDPFAVAPAGSVPAQPSSSRANWAPATSAAPVVPDHALATPWIRLGAQLINAVLIVVTLVVGYVIWTLVLWNQGTNPGKKICGLRLVKAETGQPCTFGDMLVRNFVMGSLVLSVIGTVTFGIGYLVDTFMIFGNRRQRLIDKMSGTLVVKG
jgi:uncharacterized RDD family membrane protein YckC